MSKFVVSFDVIKAKASQGVIAFFLLAGSGASSVAQTATVDPNQPERAIERLQRNQLREPPPALPRLGAPVAPADSKPLFRLRAVTLRGVHSLPRQDIASSYRGSIGRDVSAADLTAITSQIDEAYREAGFHLTRAIIAPQNAEGGRLVINIVEGRIAEITVRGGGANAAAVRNLLAPLTSETPSKRETVEHRLLLASDLPGVRITETSLEEIGTTTGQFRLIVDVQSWTNYTSVAFDNRGTNAVGPYQAYGATNFNSAFTPGDTLGVALSATPADADELRFARVTYSTPLGWDGARLSLLASHSDVQPGDFRRLFDTRDRADYFELRGTIAPIRTRDSSLWLSGAVAVGEYGERDVFGRVYADHLRTASATVDYQQKDSIGGWNYLTVNVRQGLDVFGASTANDPYLSRSDASGQFTRVDAIYSRIQTLAGPWSLKLAAAGQWASRPLLASQQFYLGAAFGRGFFGLDISGDRALAGSAELRFDQAVDHVILKGYQLYGYLDHTRLWNVQNDFGTSKLTLAGAGVRFYLPDDLQTTIELSTPLDYMTPLPKSRDARIFFGVSKAFKFCPGSIQLKCS